MTYEAVPVRFARPIGERAYYGVMWGIGTCPGHTAGHRATRTILGDNPTYDLRSPEALDWEGACEDCGERIPWHLGVEHYDPPKDAQEPPLHVFAGSERVWDTPTGQLEPGCVFYADWYGHDDGTHWCPAQWTNCNGKHLMAVCPNGHHWDIDSRAANCGLPHDTIHRCWVRHGEPGPELHVDKMGMTCSAGAGSIVAGTDYHGFLHNGAFTAG